jgi:aldose 1-epimerase
VHASTRFDRDARLVPLREGPVEGTTFDLRRGRRLGDLEFDDAFGGLETPGGVSARLTADDGREVQLWQDADFGFVQVFMTRRFPTPDGPTLAVAVEPMTAPGNALNSGVGLRWLQPGETWQGRWGIRYSP